ncbi:MAG: ribonuclease Z [Gemmatimonas sp.]|nr:ribonuclease Z [Gemmatimonas sp.]
MRVTFLGTAAARPTLSRNVSSITVQREGELLMFDCGEGTQRQMMRYGTGFTVNDIFFTHLHADHFLGVIGLLRTMGLQGRTEPIHLWVPEGSQPIMTTAANLGVERVVFPVQINGLSPGQTIDRNEYEVLVCRTKHGGLSLGYAIAEKPRLGRFNPERARQLGLPEGPLWGKLHRGETVTIDGCPVEPADLVGEPRPGRKIVISGDTRPCRATAELARDADLLIHEATFGRDEADRARQTGHSTAREAAQIAREAGALELVLTHISPRYGDDARSLEREARKIFPSARTAFDGLVVDVPYRD